MKILIIVMGILSLFSSCSGKKEKQQEKEKLYSWYPSESAPYLYPTTIQKVFRADKRGCKYIKRAPIGQRGCRANIPPS